MGEPLKFSSRDWTEDFQHENGNYVCFCMHCMQNFFGHKRRVICKLCCKDVTKAISPNTRPMTREDEAMVGLKACLGCGDDAAEDYDDSWGWCVECKSCPAATHYHLVRLHAHAQWNALNTRPPAAGESMAGWVLNSPPMSDELKALLEKAKHYKMTPEDHYKQRRSWLRGEMGIEHPDWSEEKLNQFVDEALSRMGYARPTAPDASIEAVRAAAERWVAAQAAYWKGGDLLSTQEFEALRTDRDNARTAFLSALSALGARVDALTAQVERQRVALKNMVDRFEDALVGQINDDGIEFVRGKTDIPILPDGSYMLSDARAVLADSRAAAESAAEPGVG